MRLEDLAPAAIAFVVVAIVLSIGADVLASVSAGQTGVAQAATNNGTEAMAELSSWLPTIALVIAAAVIIGVVVSYFAFNRE